MFTVITGWNDKIVALEKTTWFHFCLMKTGFLFLLQTIYLLASCVQIPRVIGAFYYVWKWHTVQRARSEIRRCTTHVLYRSKLWQQDHYQHPLNANPDGSTLEGTAQRIERPVGGGGAEGHRQEDPDQGVHRKVHTIIDETFQRPIRQIARDLGVSHTTVNACVKEDLKCRSYRRQTSQVLTEKTKNNSLLNFMGPFLSTLLNFCSVLNFILPLKILVFKYIFFYSNGVRWT